MFPPPWKDPSTFKMADVDGPEAVARRRLRGKPYQSLLRAPPDLRGALDEAPIMQISHRLNERMEEEQIGKTSQDFGLQLMTSKSSVLSNASSGGSLARPSTVGATTNRNVGGISISSADRRQRVRNQLVRSAELALPSPHRASGLPVFRPESQELFRDMWSTLESTRPQQYWMPYRAEQDRRAATARQGTARADSGNLRRPPMPVIKPVSLRASDEDSLSLKNDDYQALLGGSSIFRSMQAYGRTSPNVLVRAREQRIAEALAILNSNEEDDEVDVVSLAGEFRESMHHVHRRISNCSQYQSQNDAGSTDSEASHALRSLISRQESELESTGANVRAELSSSKYHDPALLTTAPSAAITKFNVENLEEKSTEADDNEDTVPDELRVYTADPSKGAFYRSYREVGEKRHLWTKFDEPTRTDPRLVVQEYLKAVIRKDRIPMPALLKQTSLRALDISNQGLGDDFVVALGEVILRLPYLATVNMKNSRCTDVGVDAIVSRAGQLSRLVHLDLSDNEIGAKSAISLRNFLNSHKCTLRELVVSNADVDDDECNQLMSALQINKSLTELDLSRNLIGASENLNVVKPDLVTGGEAVAEMLRTNETLKVLNLSWNAIRGDSAIDLATSLRDNQTLRKLILAYNTFGDKGSQYMGMSLITNRSIEVLDLSYNSVSPAAAMVIANAFVDNSSLRLLNLDGNKVGVRGAAALLGALRSGNDELQSRTISLDNCDSTFDDPGLFNPLAPQGTYTLRLENPYDNMVAEGLLHLATKRDGCSFVTMKYTTVGPRAKPKPIKLQRADAAPKEHSGPAVNWQAIFREISTQKRCPKSGLELSHWDCESDDMKCSECNSPIAGPEFIADNCAVPTLREPDPPPAPERAGYVYMVQGRKGAGYYGKGQKVHFCSKTKYIMCKNCATAAIRPASVASIFAYFGLTTSEESSKAVADWINTKLILTRHEITEEHLINFCFRAIFCLVDKDHGGSLDRSEILESMSFIGLQPSEKEVDRVIAQYDVDGGGTMEEDEFVNYMLVKYCGELHAEKPPLCDKGVEWHVPQEGVLQLEFAAEPMLPSDEEVGSDAGVKALLENLERMPSDAERLRVFEMAITDADVYFTPQQAQDLADAVQKFVGKIRTMAQLLPLLPTVESRVQIVQTNLNSKEQWQLRAALGTSWKVLLGNSTGYYSLDLSVPNDRLAAKLIAQVANHERQLSRDKSGGRRDTSQHGNWCNFRNESFNGEKMQLEPHWFTSLPMIGRLRFDYISTERPAKIAQAISNVRFDKVRQFVISEGESIKAKDGDDNAVDTPLHTPSHTPHASRPSTAAGSRPSSRQRGSSKDKEGSFDDNVEEVSFDNVANLIQDDDEEEDPAEKIKRHLAMVGGIITFRDVINYWVELKESSKRYRDAKQLADLQAEEAKRQAEKDKRKGGGGKKNKGNAAAAAALVGADGSTLGAASILASHMRGKMDMDEVRFYGVPGLVTLQLMQGWEDVKFLELIFEGDSDFPINVTPSEGPASSMKPKMPPSNPSSPTSVNSADGNGSIFDKIAAVNAGSNSSNSVASEMTGMSDKEELDEREDARPTTFVVAVPDGLALYQPFEVQVPGRGIPGPLYGALHAGHDCFHIENGRWMQHGVYQTMLIFDKEGRSLPKPKTVVDVRSEYIIYHPDDELEPTKTYARWYALIMKVEVSLCFKHITVQQAMDLIHLFPEDDEIRVLFLTTIFGRILDLENFYRLVELLEPEGQMEAYWRLGHLNALSPLAAERWYEFDLSNLDEREMCRVLAKLAVKEPGENWRGEHHKRKKLEPWVDGWDCPTGWDDDDDGGGGGGKKQAKAPDAELGTYGPPIEGIVDLEYYVRLKDRDVPFRVELANRFLCAPGQRK